MLVRQDYTIVEKYMDMLLCPQEALSSTLIERRYLRYPMAHTSVEQNSTLVAAVKQVQATAIFLYQDHVFDQAIDPCVWTIEVVAKVESNEEIAQVEFQIEAAIASFPVDLLESEVISETEYQELQSAFSHYQV